jgi:hypothetical protein
VPARNPPITTTVAALRLLMSALVLAAVAATYADTAGRGPVNPFNFFGYFTIQSNLLLAAVLIATTVVRLRHREPPAWMQVARGACTTYIVLVGIVYATLLAGHENGGVPLPWANTVLHVVVPLYGPLDWLLVADRPRLPWRRAWLALLFPAVWLAVVLVRGATDGWVPYPFLDPSTGSGTVALFCLAIASATLLMALVIWAFSRVRLLPERPPLRR